MPIIEALDHRDTRTAACIHAVLVVAHAQEAALLGLQRYGPLERQPRDIRHGGGDYLGHWLGNALAGVVEMRPDDDEAAHLAVVTLVVDPKHQRQGIARALMHEVIRRHAASPLVVATAAANAPALALYAGLGFVLHRRGIMETGGLMLYKLRREAEVVSSATSDGARMG